MTVVSRARAPIVLVLAVIATSAVAGCKGKASDTTAAPAETAAAPDTAQAPVAEALPASVDELVAPIALYPDQLLGQILTISTTPQEVLDVGNWILANQGIEGDALASAAKTAGFTPSAQYLVLFPAVVDNMCQELDWTTQLGEAFTSNQQGVMDAVQRKRQQAQQSGNLVSSPQMAVSTKQASNGDSYIEIAPANPKVVYVPQYDPVTVYVTAPPATTTTTTTTAQKSGVSTGAAVGIGLLSFGVGMAVGSAINNNNDYYPYPSWGYGSMYYGGRPYYPPPYRPPVYPGYRPVYGYNPPPNYRYSNRNTNVTINNNDYYSRFNNQNRPNGNNRPGNNNNRPGNNGNLANNNDRPGNSNNRPGNGDGRPGNGDGRPGNNNVGNGNRPGAGGDNRPGAGAGGVKGTYDGARPKPGDQRPGAGMANANPDGPGEKGPGNQLASRDNPRPTPGAAGNARPGGGAAAENRPSTGAQPVDRGYGDARPSTGGAAANRPSPGAANAARPSTGAAGATRPSPGPAANRPSPGAAAPASRPAPAAKPQNRPAAQPQSRPAPAKQGGGAYGGGGGGSGNSAREASSRGKSSMGSGGGNGGGSGGGGGARGAGRAH